MKRETTPEKVTDKVMELCEKAVLEAVPVYIPVKVAKGSRLHECFLNVQQAVRDRGGLQINGWAIWQWANILVEAEAHSVWQSPGGELVDITPHDNGESRILFLRDDNMVYSGQSIGNIRLALTSSPLAAELVEIGERMDAIMCSYEPGEKIPVMELGMRLLPLKERRDRIMEQLNQKVGRNELCPCQSGLKYKKCCGRKY